MTKSDILANGYDPGRFSALERHFERIIDSEIVHGASYAISHKGKLIANGALGAGCSFDNSVKMQPDSNFFIASITKTFTATAVMALVEDGLVRLDAPMSDYIKEFPFGDITPWHLLTHTSGLYPDGGAFLNEDNPSYWDNIYEAAKLHGEDYSWVTEAFTAGRRRQINEEWQYCTMGFVLLGEMIKRVSGQSAEDFITERVIKPIGLGRTGFKLTSDAVSNFYIGRQKMKEIFDTIATGNEYIPPDTEDERIEAIVNKKVPRTGGGMYSNVIDLIKFGEFFLNKGKTETGEHVIGRKIIEKMTSEQLFNVPDYCWFAKEPNRRFGIGFDMRRPPSFVYSPGSFHHEGAGPSALYIDPKEQLVAAWFSPWNKGEWCSDPLWNTHNVIWSGLV